MACTNDVLLDSDKVLKVLFNYYLFFIFLLPSLKQNPGNKSIYILIIFLWLLRKRVPTGSELEICDLKTSCAIIQGNIIKSGLFNCREKWFKMKDDTKL